MRRVRFLFVAVALAGCSKPAPSPWQAVPLATDAHYNGMWFTDSLNGWLSGGAREVPGGVLGRTRDGGRTWTIRSNVVPMGEDFAFGDVEFSDTLRGWAVGGGGAVMLTEDGGHNWRQVRFGRSGSDALMRLKMLDRRVGWAIGPASLVGTKDGGETWAGVVYNRAENGYLSGNAFAFTDEFRGFLVGHGGQLWRTDDEGASWTRVPLPLPKGLTPTLWDIQFVDGVHGWLVGEEGTICNTVDAGNTWMRDTIGVPRERVLPRGEKPRPPDIVPGLDDGPSRLSLTAVGFADFQRGFALGWYSDVGESVILGTRDGGATWQTELVAPGQYLHTLFVLDRSHAWAAGDRSRTLPQAVYRYAAAD